jgi:hypothetical protein
LQQRRKRYFLDKKEAEPFNRELQRKRCKFLLVGVVCFYNKKMSLKNALACYFAGVVVVNAANVGLDPGFFSYYVN